LDQTKNYKVLSRPGSINRVVYSNSLLQSLKDRVKEQREKLCGDSDSDDACNVKIDYDAAMAAKTIMELEDAVIAPLYGFDDFFDYYRSTSSINFICSIAVPTLVINAKDDPFMDPSVWPVNKTCEYGGPAPIKMIRTRHGGHLGFGFHLVDEGDERLQTEGDEPWPSWASWELGRFLDHVRKYDTTK